MKVTKNDILNMLCNPKMSDDIWLFEEDGTASKIDNSDYLYFINILRETSKAIWLRGVEHYSKDIWDYCKSLGSSNCHVIIAPKGSKLLSQHIDLIDVKINCLWGKRSYNINGDTLVLEAGHTVTIPRGVVHEVNSIDDCITINFGINKFFNTLSDSVDYLENSYLLLNKGVIPFTEGDNYITDNKLTLLENHKKYKNYILDNYYSGVPICFVEMEKYSKEFFYSALEKNSMSVRVFRMPPNSEIFCTPGNFGLIEEVVLGEVNYEIDGKAVGSVKEINIDARSSILRKTTTGADIVSYSVDSFFNDLENFGGLMEDHPFFMKVPDVF